MSFHTIVTSRASYYAPPDTGVPNLILVASEQLPSIEGAVEILMDVPFLRGLCISRSELTQVVPLDLQIEGGEKGFDLGAGFGGCAPAEAAVRSA